MMEVRKTFSFVAPHIAHFSARVHKHTQSLPKQVNETQVGGNTGNCEGPKSVHVQIREGNIKDKLISEHKCFSESQRIWVKRVHDFQRRSREYCTREQINLDLKVNRCIMITRPINVKKNKGEIWS